MQPPTPAYRRVKIGRSEALSPVSCPAIRALILAMTLHVFRLARAALIYLSLGMHGEEQRRNKANPKAKKASMRLDVWRDAWKGSIVNGVELVGSTIE